MALSLSNRTLALLTLAAAMAVLALLARPGTSLAVSSYASATGQACGVCHVNPGGGGRLTATGSAFQAVRTHSSDPAGAWAQISNSGSPTPTPSPVVEPTPPPTTTEPTPAPTSGWRQGEDDEGEGDNGSGSGPERRSSRHESHRRSHTNDDD